MPALTARDRTTGMIITFQWSRQGHWQQRRQAWGMKASSWGGVKLGGSPDGLGLLDLPKSITFREGQGWMESNLTQADRVAVVFPHGTVQGASAMSVHTHNIT